MKNQEQCIPPRIAGLCFIATLLVVIMAGLPASVLASVSPPSAGFGDVAAGTTSPAQSFSISNEGAGDLTVSSVALTGNDAGLFRLTAGTCATLTPTIPPGQSCTVNVAFAPIAAGSRGATLQVNSDDPVTPVANLPLTGNGLLQLYTLSIGIQGLGGGTVHSAPGTDIACGSGTCSQPYASGTTVTLTQQPDATSLFAGWSGCDTVVGGVCSVLMGSARNVTASFANDPLSTNYRWISNGPTGGAIASLALSPEYGTDQTAFAATAGGLFISTNHGATWNLAGTGLPSVVVRSVALSPAFATDRTVVAATSGGIAISSDAGMTWALLLGQDMAVVALSPGFAVDRTILAGNANGVLKSNDSGTTWIAVNSGLSSLDIHALSISPAYSVDQTVYAATAGGVYLTTDGGVAWSPAGTLLTGQSISSVALSPNFSSDGMAFAGTASGVYRFDAFAGEWIPANSGIASQQILSLAVSPAFASDQTLYAGTPNGLFRSSNAGGSWNQLSMGNSIPPSIQSLALSPQFASDGIVYAGSTGRGIYLSADRGAIWAARNSGLIATRVGKVAYSPAYATDQTAFAAVPNAGIYKTSDRGGSWQLASTGIDTVDVTSVAVSPAFSSDLTVFACSGNGIFRSTNGGASWLRVNTSLQLYSLLAVSPNFAIDMTVYAGSGTHGIFRSTDGGITWAQINGGLTSLQVSDLAVSPAFASDTTLFAGTGSGVFRSTDSGTLWESVSNGKVPNGDLINAVAISPDFASDRTVFAGTPAGMIITGDSGTTWSEINAGLGNQPVSTIAVSPDYVTDRTLLAGTSSGVFRTTNSGGLWKPANLGLVNPQINSLAFSPAYAADRQAFAGTWGSGVARLTPIDPDIALSPSSIDFGSVATMSSSATRTITVTNTGLAPLLVSGIDLSGTDAAQFSLNNAGCGTPPLTLAASASCSVEVTFNPTTTGPKSATLQIASNAVTAPLKETVLAGTAYDPPPVGTIQINGGASVTPSAAVTLTLNALDNSGTVADMRFSNTNTTWSDWQLYATSAPWNLSTLGGDGLKTVYVQFRDAAGNASGSFSATITLNSTAPVTTITSMPAAHYSSGTGTFTFSSSKPGTFACSLDSSPFAACSSPYQFTGVADGPHTFSVHAIDTLGTIGPDATNAWVTDTAAPDTSITANPAALVNLSGGSFAFSSTETGATFECGIDNAPMSPCTTPFSFTGLGDGSHTFAVRAKDQAGNVDPTPASYTWTIDTVAPETTITTHPANPANSGSGSFSFTASEPGSTLECSLDGSPFASCTSPYPFSGLADGPHSFAARATDPAGNTDQTPAAFSWTVDTVPPVTTIATKPASITNQPSGTFTFTANEAGSSFECQLDGGAFSACISPYPFTGLADGLHSFTVRATDPAGNLETAPPGHTWTIDTAPPDTAITSQPPDPSTTNSGSFTFTATKPGSTFQCSMDGAPYSACSTPYSFSGLANGPHTFSVRAVDQVGNIDPTPASASWTITVSAPNVRLVTPGLPDTFFATLTAALAAMPAAPPSLIMTRQLDFAESVDINRCGTTVTIGQAYEPGFVTPVGPTVISGALIVTCGTVILDNVEIR